MSHRTRRVKSLEAATDTKRVPSVIEIDVWSGETKEQAFERFRRKWGALPKSALIVPARVNAENRDEFLRRFKLQQLRSIEAAKSSRKG